MEKQTPAFVYGTLREGLYNYNRILKGNVESKAEATLEEFEMYSVGAFPAITPGEGRVTGELMYIKPDIYNTVLSRLDMLEGYNARSVEDSMYLREKMEVQLENGEKVEAYVYVWNRKIPYEKVESGDWVRFLEGDDDMFLDNLFDEESEETLV